MAGSRGIGEGKKAKQGALEAVATKDGTTLAELPLEAAPVFDGGDSGARFLLLLSLLAACTTVPGTGRSQLLLMSSDQETQLGITEFENEEAMSSAFEALSEHEAFAAYTATFETVASQFTRPTTNH